MKLTCSRTCGEPFSPSWTIAASSIGMRCLWMQASFRQKKGRGSRENQAGKGIEVLGIGRWQGCSSRKPYRQPPARKTTTGKNGIKRLDSSSNRLCRAMSNWSRIGKTLLEQRPELRESGHWPLSFYPEQTPNTRKTFVYGGLLIGGRTFMRGRKAKVGGLEMRARTSDRRRRCSTVRQS